MTRGMRMRTRAAMLAAAVTAALVVGVPSGSSAAGPGQTVKVKTTLTINKEGYFGYVKSKNTNCLESRNVVVKQVGNGALARTKSDASGKWTASIDEMNENFDIELPSKLYAEVKPITQATAGPIYRCLAATSRQVTP